MLKKDKFSEELKEDLKKKLYDYLMENIPKKLPYSEDSVQLISDTVSYFINNIRLRYTPILQKDINIFEIKGELYLHEES